MPTRSLALLLSTGAIALGVTACGSSSSSSSAAPSAGGGGTTAAAAATGSAYSASSGSAAPAASSGGGSGAAAGHATKISLGVMGQNLMFTHTTLQARAGTVRISFSNASGIGHNLTVQKGTDGRVVGATPTFSNGTHTLTLHLSPGTYTYFCSVPGHRQAGMVGTLKVS
jgi:plastocyanin